MSDLSSSLGSSHSSVDSLSKLGGANQEELRFLSGGDEHVVLIFPFLFVTIFEGRDPVSVFLIIIPLSFVFETIRAFTDAEAASLVVLPLAHVRLNDIDIGDVILADKAEVAVSVHGHIGET